LERKARLSEIKISELQSEAAQLRNEIELVRHRHAVEQTRWLDARSRHTGELLSSNSVRSSIGLSDTDLESLDHHEASVSGAETSNQSQTERRQLTQMRMKIGMKRTIVRANICRWLSQEYPKKFKSLTYVAIRTPSKTLLSFVSFIVTNNHRVCTFNKRIV
jgi:hypothetical protein